MRKRAVMTDFATALLRLWPNGDEKIPDLRAPGIIASAPAVFTRYGIVTPQPRGPNVMARPPGMRRRA